MKRFGTKPIMNSGAKTTSSVNPGTMKNGSTDSVSVSYFSNGIVIFCNRIFGISYLKP